jgi:DNA-binding NarL/FixJ family response regulator
MQELGAVIRNLLERAQIIQSEWRFSTDDQTRSPQKSAPSTTIQKNDNRHQAIASVPIELNLTEREQQVLNFLAKGSSNVEIGNKLHLSPRTIEKYVSSLLRKTETSNRAELVRFALENQLVD